MMRSGGKQASTSFGRKLHLTALALILWSTPGRAIEYQKKLKPKPAAKPASPPPVKHKPAGHRAALPEYVLEPDIEAYYGDPIPSGWPLVVNNKCAKAISVVLNYSTSLGWRTEGPWPVGGGLRMRLSHTDGRPIKTNSDTIYVGIIEAGSETVITPNGTGDGQYVSKSIGNTVYRLGRLSGTHGAEGRLVTYTC